jgi:hypothetical protein
MLRNLYFSSRIVSPDWFEIISPDRVGTTIQLICAIVPLSMFKSEHCLIRKSSKV